MVMAVLALLRICKSTLGYGTAPKEELVLGVNAPEAILTKGIMTVRELLLSSVQSTNN